MSTDVFDNNFSIGCGESIGKKKTAQNKAKTAASTHYLSLVVMKIRL